MRSSWLFTFLLLTLVFSSLHAQSYKSSLMPNPRASLISDLLHSPYPSSSTKRTSTHLRQAVIEWKVKNQDSGFLETGQSFQTNYKFTNKGGMVLEIQGVSCNCNGATINIPDQVIQPGQEGVINVHLTRSLQGPFFCHLSVLSNTEEIVDVLTISGVAFQAD